MMRASANHAKSSQPPVPTRTPAPAAARPLPGARRGGLDFEVLSVGGTPLLRKLTVGASHDPAEAEADTIADRVMRMPTAAGPIGASRGGVQRKCAACESEDTQVRRKTQSPAGGMAAPAIVSDVLASSGQPLDAATRGFMAPRFGRDFANVRIHTGERAARSAAAVGAKAYTVGQNIVFGDGQYAPRSDGGARLLAHELTHTIQQDGGAPSVRRAQLDIKDANAMGPLQANDRRAAASCPITCDRANVGTLHAMALFNHTSRGAALPNNTGADGIGAQLHFIKGANPPAGNACASCTDFKFIQVLNTNQSPDPRAPDFVDNNSSATPFYDDVGVSGAGNHAIPTGYPDAGNNVTTTRSMYDRPFRNAGHLAPLHGHDFHWRAETCVTCRRPTRDKVLGCVTYGFDRAWNATSNSFDPPQAVSPGCLASPTTHFVNTVRHDPSTSTYQFET